MKYPVRLFLGNEEVEFSTPPAILFNYSETELTNPTIVKNAYSKTITIEGTKTNNQIFGHIYDMQRIQYYDGRVMGSAFNPLVKTEFTLYYNGSIYESGYFKLDEVRRNDNNIEYDISLYGGLGDYFYNLSFREDGTPMELSDLKYEWEVNNDSELGFQINKEAVAEAWLYMWQPSSKWDTINFAPCYNGVPTNISADKFLISKGVYPFPNSSSGYCLGTSEHEHTEWETFDLRSYLQRPVLRVREVLKACTDPRNNGGYTVNLDSDFFTPSNPYYQDSWMTLPMLPDLDVPETVSSALTISAITHESGALYKLWDGGANATNVQVDVNVNFTPSGSYSGDSVYLFRDYEANGGVTLQSRFAKSFWADSAILIQMLGYNASGQISTVSNVFRLVTPPEGDYSVKTMPEWMRENFENVNPATDINGISNVIGKFTKKNGQFVFTDLDGNTQTLRFTFPSDAEFTKLKLKILPQYSYSLKRTFTGGSASGRGWEVLDFWSSRYRHSNSWQDETIVRNLDKVNGSVSYSPVGATGTTTSFEGFFSNRTYSKRDLLTLGVSPAQFLLSYAKAFGLYFIKDVEKKEITILSRHNFYKRDEIVNINDLIDKGSDIKIIPNSPKYQYYDFAFEQVDSEAAEAYRKAYGNEYGTATVNTGYQYEKEHKALLDGNIFKGGVTVMEKNKYFFKPVQGTPQLIWNGFSYTYVNGQGQNVEDKINPEPMHGTIINPDGLKYYDYMAKLQFHNANNEASDGSMVLVFCDNVISGAESCGYKLTDDVPEMYTLNDGQPCWLLVSGTTDASGNTIAVVPNRIPHFTRDIYNYQHYIENSLDMGTPLTTYVPNGFVSDWQSIYSKSWKSYISDLYDVNTRVLRCRCLLRERPNPDWMRRFYWFDNSYWRLNEIKDWDISSFETTEMEFIKVQDINNYDNVLFSNCPIVEDRFEQHFISYTGGTITGIIYVSDGSGLAIGQDGVPVRYSNGTQEVWDPQGVIDPIYPSGVVNVRVNVTIPANTSNYTRTITLIVEDACDQFHYITLTQGIEEHNATITPTTLSFTDMGGTKTLTISDPSNHGWTVGSTSNWITLSQTGGTGSTTVTVTAAVNPSSTGRDTSITFRDANTSISTNITVTQAANIDATVYPTGPVSVNESGGTAYFTISDPSNHGWTFNNTGTSWIHVSPSAGTGSDSVVVTFDRNETEYNRSSIMVFSDDSNGTTTTISVTQAADYPATVTPTSIVTDFSGTSRQLTISDRNNHGWSITGVPSWMIVSDTEGTGSTTVTLSFGINDTSVRTATLYFTDEATQVVTEISVKQTAFVEDYLALDIVSGGTIRFYASTYDTTGAVKTAQYSRDGGETWTPVIFNNSSYIDVASGETILLRRYQNHAYGDSTEYGASLSGSTASFNVRGNIMSLVWNDFEGKTDFSGSTTQVFRNFFQRTNVRDASGLKLPALTLRNECYSAMFSGCTSLTAAPALPATSLTESCYLSMFSGCSSLQTAPELPAPILVNSCYSFMFLDCTSLNKITCLATSTGATHSTYRWVRNVAESGTFTKKASMNDWTIGENGIPTSWVTNNTSYATPYITPQTWVFPPFGSGRTITITIVDADNRGWRFANSYPDWIYLTATSGSGTTTVRAVASENETGSRYSLFNFIDGGSKTTKIFALQQEGSAIATVSPRTFSFNCLNGIDTIYVTDEGSHGWELTTSSSWFSLYPTSGTGTTQVSIMYEANSGSARNSSITFTDKTSLTTSAIYVEQEAHEEYPASITPTRLDFDNSSNTKTLTISDPSNHGWHINKSATWFSLSATAGTGNSSVIVTAQANLTINNRSATFTFYDDATSASTNGTVYQPKTTGTINYSFSETGFTVSGGVATVTISDAYQRGWGISNIPEWISFQQTEGTGSTAFTYTVLANETTSSRTATLSLVSKITGIDIYQSGQTPTPTFSCLLNFTYGDVTIPQSGTWDDYIIFYSETETRPAGTGDAMASLSCGSPQYAGNTWNPSNATWMSVYSPFSEYETGNYSKISVPDSFAGKTIYIQAEFGSNDLGYAIYSTPVTVQIPSGGGTVNVTIPQF